MDNDNVVDEARVGKISRLLESIGALLDSEKATAGESVTVLVLAIGLVAKHSVSEGHDIDFADGVKEQILETLGRLRVTEQWEVEYEDEGGDSLSSPAGRGIH